ncbi:MAG TPA: sigma-70 family RNA polymerase sigma factor, partial [Gemmataceae bacterium]
MHHATRALLYRATCPGANDVGTDADLLARFAADRDEAAFAAIVERYGPMVLGVARRILRDCNAADDVFQATFLALVRSASTVRRPGGLPAWLHRTAYRAAVKLARTRRPVPLAVEQPATAVDPLDVLTARELLAAVDDEIRRLPAALRAAVIACGLEGRSQDEAAQLLGWTPGQVRGRLERGRRRLEERLYRRGLALAASGVLLLSPRPVLTAALRDAAVLVGTGRMAAPRVVAALAASAGRTMPVRAVALVLGLAAVGLAGLAAGRPLHTAAPIPIPARVAPSSDGTVPEGALRRFGAAHYRVGDGPIAVTPDGSSIVSVSPQGVVRVLGSNTGRVIAEHSLPMSSKAFYTNSQAVLSADGSTAVTGMWNGDGNTLTVWDLATRRSLWARTNTNGVSTDFVALSANGKRLAVVEPSADWKQSSLRIVDFNSGETRLLANLAASIRRVLLSPDGKRVVLVTGGDDASAGACHDIDTGKKLWSIPRLARMLAFSTDGSILFATEKNTYTRVLVLDANTGKSMDGVKMPEQIHDLGIPPLPSPDGHTVLLGDIKIRGFILWDYKAGKELGVIPAYSYSGDYRNRAAAFSRDGKTLFTTIDRLRRWDAATGKPLDQADPADGHDAPVPGVRYSADGREVYSLGTDQRFARWSVAGKLLESGKA